MKPIFRKVLIYILFFVLYMLPSIMFKADKAFYSSLNNNFVPVLLFIIVWSIIFILVSYINTHYLFNITKYNRKDVIVYFVIASINYIFIYLFPLVFFEVKSLTLGYIVTLLTTVTYILLAMQSLLLNKKKSLIFLVPITWTIFASIYSIILFLSN